MPKITALKPVKRQKGWYELHFDKGNAFKVNDELILKHRLKINKILKDNEIKKLREQAGFLFLKKKAFEILSRRHISEKELQRKLRSVPGHASFTDRVLKDLQEQGYINDYDFAVSYIHSIQAKSSHSKRYISQKLYLKGVPAEITAKAIADELKNYDEYEIAKRLGEKKFRTVRQLPALKAKKRIADFLRGRGFDWNVINSVVSELFTPED